MTISSGGKIFLKTIVAAAFLGALAYFGYRYWILSKEDAAFKTVSAIQTQQITELNNSLNSANTTLAQLQITLSSTTASLNTAQAIVNSFGPQINELSGTVGQITKIAATDPHLLQKYSKVYFLNENYVPASLSSIDTKYLYNASAPELILSGILPDLESLFASAARDGIKLQAISAYRSFYQQSQLKLDYVVTYGAGTANQISAEQGFSEHQLGTAVDFGTPNAANLRTQFASSSAYAWLVNNAYQFGFVISYPQQNIYYQYEPWHWRYVGIKLATYLHANNEYFYNLSQDQINQYLGNFYDSQ